MGDHRPMKSYSGARYALAIPLTLTLALVVTAPFFACVGDSPPSTNDGGCVAGGEGCSCNVGKCLSGLTCASGVCVSLGDGAADGNGGGDAGDSGLVVDGGGTIPATCKDYCSVMMTACPGGTANGQYSSQAICEAMCAKFAPGANGAQTGNSFACRAYHASQAALGTANATFHCPHAGPFGFGVCGTESENFCAAYLGFCTGVDGGYLGISNCPAVFDTVVDTTDGGTFLNGTGPRDCREYHLENAYGAGDPAGPHCVHASKAGGGLCP